MISLSPTIVVELASTACLAGFVDTLAGGGGLITLPALMLTGIPVINVLATSKLQSTFGSSTATLMMLRHRLLNLKEHGSGFFYALIGAVIGTSCVQLVNTHALDVLIPIALLGVCLYVLFSPKLGDVTTHARMSASLYRRLL
jgi:uncharacterized membrane protein YfcA